MRTAHRILSEALTDEEFRYWKSSINNENIRLAYAASYPKKMLNKASVILKLTLPSLTRSEEAYWIKVYERLMGTELNTEQEQYTARNVADTLSLNDKKVKLSKGLYFCRVPPVTAQLWTETDWIKFIDQTGGWR